MPQETLVSPPLASPRSTRPPRTIDVVVAGAGPAGCSAAITLARLGRSVVLVDKAVFPRDKCCGDGLTTAALRHLECLGLDPVRVPSWQPVREVVVVGSQGRRVDLQLPNGDAQFAASARRFELDAALADLAEQAGAHLIDGRAVRNVQLAQRSPGWLEVDLEGEMTLRCSYVIAADGAWSPVRKALGLSGTASRVNPDGRGRVGDWFAGRQYYRTTGTEAGKLWVWFEQDMLPGYVWSFPLAGGIANVGYGVLRNPSGGSGTGGSGAGLRGQRVTLTDRPRIAAALGADAEPVGPWRAWPIPVRVGSATLAALGGRVLFVGDAARACDPMTGEGIAQALETGKIAAQAIAVAGPSDPSSAERRYRREVRFGMALDHHLAAILSKVLARPGGSEAALAIVSTSSWGRRNFVRWMFEDYPRAVLATPHRWKRRMFSQQGAYPA